MKQTISTFAYSFDLSYYENFLANRRGEMRNMGQFNEIYERLWSELDDTKVVNGITVNNGIDITEFIKVTYNGSVTLCMIDSMAQAIADVIGSVLGCGIAKAIFSIVDSFTDIFGSFICTATVETLGTGCGQEFLNTLKKYRDTKVMTDREGINMVRYYSVIGPRIVTAIENDFEKQAVYAYLWNNYIQSLGSLVEADSKELIIFTYFNMMDDMVKKYDLETSKSFTTWLDGSKEKYKGSIDG